ncbi:MAG: ArdC-like ssDNA-binding domain-containing protein [Bryobacteraceae bacterium]
MAVSNKVEWESLLAQVISEPGTINEAYRRFHGFSLGNRIWAMTQCAFRGIAPGPLASFNRWTELGRHVKKGEKALSLCMPVSGKRKQTDEEGGNETETSYQFFVCRNNCFVLSQTDGVEYIPEPLPEWSEAKALEVVG